ncbi:hypothetical protein MRB53_023142 [Persea americana]|uniref:Uncharacterized protein n=1 Tax=Persea americana TaxID=3435 RepID=A0ACC2L9U9_PERAE|nr:hypothetical protein MRB53_023142 [Persea americana]
MEELVNDAFGRIGENVDALMDDLIRNRDIHESSQEFQGEDEGEERRYKKYKTYLSTTTPKGPKKKGGVSKNIEHDFINWLRQEMESVEGEPILKRLAVGPMFKAKCYNKYRSSMLPKQRMVITLNAHGLPVGDNSTKLSSRCGQLVRSIVPISYKDWHAVPNEKKVELWKLLLEDFDVSQSYKDKCLRSMAESMRKYKTKLRMQYLNSHKTQEEKLNNRPPGVRPEDWEVSIRSLIQFNPSDVIILEGILAFHDPRVRELMNVKIFVDTGMEDYPN